MHIHPCIQLKSEKKIPDGTFVIKSGLLVNFFVLSWLSSYWVNTTSKRGIKKLGISSGSIFLLFLIKAARSTLIVQVAGGNPSSRHLMTALHYNGVFVLVFPLSFYYSITERLSSLAILHTSTRMMISVAL